MCVRDYARKQPQRTMLPHGLWCGLPCLFKLWDGCAIGYARLLFVPYSDGGWEGLLFYIVSVQIY